MPSAIQPQPYYSKSVSRLKARLRTFRRTRSVRDMRYVAFQRIDILLSYSGERLRKHGFPSQRVSDGDQDFFYICWQRFRVFLKHSGQLQFFVY